MVKAIALGADAVYIGTAALVAMGCTLCQKYYTGICNWGICTQDPYLAKRINPEIASRRLLNLLRAWSMEIKEMLGGMGINAIESLRGNRDHLRGVALQEWELDVLGVKGAGVNLLLFFKVHLKHFIKLIIITLLSRSSPPKCLPYPLQLKPHLCSIFSQLLHLILFLTKIFITHTSIYLFLNVVR